MRLEIKRGDTLDWQCTCTVDGVAVNLAGWGVACSLRGPGGGVVHEFVPVVTDASAGRFSLCATPSHTAAWPVGTLVGDIQYTDPSGRVMSTRTFRLSCLEDVTQ
jgi:hypothetical protein